MANEVIVSASEAKKLFNDYNRFLLELEFKIKDKGYYYCTSLRVALDAIAGGKKLEEFDIYNAKNIFDTVDSNPHKLLHKIIFSFNSFEALLKETDDLTKETFTKLCQAVTQATSKPLETQNRHISWNNVSIATTPTTPQASPQEDTPSPTQ